MATRNPSTKKSAGTPAEKTPRTRKTATSEGGSGRQGSAPRASAPKRLGATKIAAEAARQLLELTGRASEGVTGLERTDDGWTVQVEVVEVRRIPETTDVLALYDVEVDEDGELLGYQRVRRFIRGTPGEE